MAVPLSIQFTGVNLSYSGGTISDSVSPSGGNNNPAQADPLDTMTFLSGGLLAGPVLTSNISVDISIPNVVGLSNINPSTTMTTVGNPGYFDLLIGSPTSAAQYLRLDTSQVTVTYVNTTNTVRFVFGGAVADVEAQNLPYGLVIGDPVTVSFSSLVTAKTASGGLVTSFSSSGTGEVNYIPEPATCVLAALGLAGMFVGRRRA